MRRPSLAVNGRGGGGSASLTSPADADGAWCSRRLVGFAGVLIGVGRGIGGGDGWSGVLSLNRGAGPGGAPGGDGFGGGLGATTADRLRRGGGAGARDIAAGGSAGVTSEGQRLSMPRILSGTSRLGTKAER